MSALITARLTANDVTEVVSAFGITLQWSFLTFVLFLGFITWWIWGLENYKRQREHSKPYFKVQRHGDWQFYVNKVATWGALQIWFVNKPKVASDNAVAKDVTATITLYDRVARTKIERPGCFIEAESFDWAGNVRRLQKIDEWPPNDEPRKLQVALRWPSEDIAYIFTYTTSMDWGREEPNAIAKGTHYLEVSFAGTRVDQPSLWFLLENPGRGKSNPFLRLIKPIKKPNLRKEASQTQ
ncbi:MAG: hypothetical protein HY325_04080 [Chloroflexi bacterium]|nr:hypothetical protein [Chloroflexota bacterium]